MTTENYNERAEELKNKWKAQKNSAQIYTPGENAQSNNFIFDGIADPNEWYKQDIRPLFILKEAYNIELNEDEWNEVTWFLSEKSQEEKIKNKTWQTLCRWSSYIFSQNYDAETIWGNEYLKKIALINIKKYGGQKTSNDSDLKKHAEKHADLIVEQIELIKPTIIICGYTGWLMDIVWQNEFGRIIRENKRNGRVYDIDIPEYKKITLIDFWHPASRNNHQEDFTADIDAAMGRLPSHIRSNEEPQNEGELNECN